MTFFTDNILNSLGFFAKTEQNEAFLQLLKNIGEISAGKIAANAAAVDKKGCSLENGRVKLCKETVENIKLLRDTGYLGSSLPVGFGGKNLPRLFAMAAVEMISRADASLMTLVSLQDIALTIEKYGTEDQKRRLLPGISSGETSCAMALSEPGAGSDLQAVRLEAQESDGVWLLNGTKHFITNGDADLLLVLARSEAGSKDGRGLSLFILENPHDSTVTVTRLEQKTGINGSPTCSISFQNARCELLGRRRFGLIRYVLELLTGARLSVAAQALGIAEAARHEALRYTSTREQFGNKINNFAQVRRMLDNMGYEIGSTRIMLYFAANLIDVSAAGSETERETASETELLSSILKYGASELANRIVYDAVQLFGGVGYLKDIVVGRLSRDVRVTTIYEGTSQIQVLSALSKIKNGVFSNIMDRELEKLPCDGEIARIKEISETLSRISDLDPAKCDFFAPELVEASFILLRLVLLKKFSISQNYAQFVDLDLLKSDFLVKNILL